MGAGPTLVLDWESTEPVYVQIARQIRDRIVAGEVSPGTVLPPVRTMASDLGVNLNTVARAYWQLEEEGFLRIRSRAGAEVIPPARGRDAATVERLREDLRTALARLRQCGLAAPDLRRMVEKELAAFGGGE